MNFSQGMRRLAILAGVLGVVAGAFYAHEVLRSVAAERHQHKVFETMAASGVVKQEQTLLLSARAKSEGKAHDYDALAKKYGGVRGVPPGLTAEPIPPPVLPAGFNDWDVTSTEVNSDRIKTIHWKPDYSVDFFEMQDGGYLFPGVSPSAWLYLLWVAYPALGFFIAWGTVRAIRWVVIGFLPNLN